MFILTLILFLTAVGAAVIFYYRKFAAVQPAWVDTASSTGEAMLSGSVSLGKKAFASRYFEKLLKYRLFQFGNRDKARLVLTTFKSALAAPEKLAKTLFESGLVQTVNKLDAEADRVAAYIDSSPWWVSIRLKMLNNELVELNIVLQSIEAQYNTLLSRMDLENAWFMVKVEDHEITTVAINRIRANIKTPAGMRQFDEDSLSGKDQELISFANLIELGQWQAVPPELDAWKSAVKSILEEEKEILAGYRQLEERRQDLRGRITARLAQGEKRGLTGNNEAKAKAESLVALLKAQPVDLDDIESALNDFETLLRK